MEGLDFGGILGEAEVNAIFGGSEETTETETQETPPEEKENNKEQEEATEVTSVEDLFNTEESESVGSEDEHKEKEEPKSTKAGSPNTYSSIAKAFADEEIEIIELLKRYTDKDRNLSKYQACKYLNMSRATFDNYVREGKIPKGKKEAGFKELLWKESELRALCLQKNK